MLYSSEGRLVCMIEIITQGTDYVKTSIWYIQWPILFGSKDSRPFLLSHFICNVISIDCVRKDAWYIVAVVRSPFT